MSSDIEIVYTNYKGVRRKRYIRPQENGIHFQEGNQFHPEPQWLLFATDLEDGKLKTWAMKGIHSWKPMNREDRHLQEVLGKQLSRALVKTKKYVDRVVITNKEGEPYLERITVKFYPDGSRDMLHIIYRSDDDRDMHDHPFNFQSRIIWGSYVNHMATGAVTYSPGMINIMRAEDAHRLEVLEGPVITMVHRGPKIRDWGFHTIDGWVHHKEYLDKKFGPGNWVDV